MPINKMRPIHPGEILAEEFMGPLDLSANQLAQAIGVPANRVSMIIAGTRAISADTALRLARAFQTTPEFWLNLQNAFDLRTAALDASSRKVVAAIRPLSKAS